MRELVFTCVLGILGELLMFGILDLTGKLEERISNSIICTIIQYILIILMACLAGYIFWKAAMLLKAIRK
jgi:ABC-type glycerol-3-phosphate transport system permease component